MLSDANSHLMDAYTKAATFALHAHKNQLRKAATELPYFTHVVAVATHVMEAGVRDPKIVAAALLHDTIEDCGVTAEQLTAEFGAEVASIVQECSDDKSLDKVQRKRLQIEHAATASYEAKIVKLADKYANVSDLLRSKPAKWSDEEVLGYGVWAFHVVKAIGDVNATFTAQFQELFAQFFAKFGGGTDMAADTAADGTSERRAVSAELDKYYARICHSE